MRIKSASFVIPMTVNEHSAPLFPPQSTTTTKNLSDPIPNLSDVGCLTPDDLRFKRTMLSLRPQRVHLPVVCLLTVEGSSDDATESIHIHHLLQQEI